MACYKPVRAFKAPGGGVSFNPKSGYVDRELMLPCGQCIGCRLERSRQWAVRCMHEASMHDQNCFVTLTYAKPPAGGSLDRTAFPELVRKIRKRYTRERIKYFHCGEYGELLARPHYHGLIFGFDFPDKTPWRVSDQGHQQFRSKLLEELWPAGYSSLGPVTFETAAYTARYCTKKINGDRAAAHYGTLEPEFMTCSKGIGEGWFKRYADETYRDDSVVARGHEQRPPRYYDKKFAELAPEKMRQVQLERIVRGNTSEQKWNRTEQRLEVRETVKRAALGELKRGIE